MKPKEPAFMQELHKIREKITKEWKSKSPQQISFSLRQTVKNFKHRYTLVHR